MLPLKFAVNLKLLERKSIQIRRKQGQESTEWTAKENRGDLIMVPPFSFTKSGQHITQLPPTLAAISADRRHFYLTEKSKNNIILE